MDKEFENELVINMEPVITSLRRFLETKGSLTDVRKVDKNVVESCVDTLAILEIYWETFQGE